MYEQEKLQEARFFLSQLSTFRESPHEFRFVLSAFLSSARSALQYALEEAKSKPGGKAWYDSQIQSDPLLKFFKDKRDLSIHVAPVVPRRILNMQSTVHVHVTDSVSITVKKADGTLIEEVHSDPKPPIAAPPAISTVSTSYFFEELGKETEIEAIAMNYIAMIERIVADGVTRGFISG